MEYISFFEYLKTEGEYSNIFRRICEFDSELKKLHEKGYCVNNLDFDSMHLVSDGNSLLPMFSNVLKSSEQEIKNQNIRDFAYLSLGVFVSLKMGGGLVYDYAKICRSNPDFIINNYLTISDVILDFNGISECKGFYDKIINGQYDYLTNYITNMSNKNDANKGNNKGAVLSYYTPVGKMLTQDSDAAFVNTMFYPIVIICVIAIVIMIYLLYKYL